MSGDDLFCKLYVAGAPDPAALAAAVANLTGGRLVGPASLIDTPVLHIAVHAPSRHLPLDDGQDDFVRWRHFLDVDAASAHMPLDAFVGALAPLVAGLRARGWRVVAACDFEEVLEAAVQGASGG